MLKVSVVIPVYNVEKYLEKCLQSVAAQSYGNIECIVVDDRGADSSMQIAERFVSAYKGCIDFKIVRHEKNRGASAARNTGVDESSGDYVCFLDSDDFLPADSIENYAARAELLMPDVVLGDTLMFHEDDEAFESETELIRSSFPPNIEITQPRILNQRIGYRYEILYVTPWGKIMRRQFLVENGIRFEEGILVEDELWTFVWQTKAKTLLYLDRVTYYYRQRGGSLSMQSPSLKNKEAMIHIIDSWEKVALSEIGRMGRPQALQLAFFCERHIENMPSLFLPFGFRKTYAVYKSCLSGRRHMFPAEIMKAMPAFRKIMSIHRRLPAPLGFGVWYAAFKIKRCILCMRSRFAKK